MNKYNVAVVGATGAVGETLLSILEQRNFPVDQVFALASERSAGNTVMFNNKPLMVTDLAEFDFSQAQIGLFLRRRQHFRRIRPKGRRGGLCGHR